MELFPVAFIGLVFLAIFGWQWNRRRSALQSWNAFAADHDFSFFEPGFFSEYQMSGTYDGVEVEVYTETRGSGKNSTTYTVYAASIPEGAPFDLVVYDEGMLSQVGKLFGGQDIEVGDPEVDDAFIFRSDHPSEVHRFFQKSGVMEAFRGLARASRSVQIDHGAIQLEQGRLETNRAELERPVNTLTRFVRDIDAALKSSEEPRTTTPAVATSDAAAGTDRTESQQGASEDEVVEDEFAVEW